MPLYPKPDRSNYTPHGKTQEDASFDIGWDEGFLSDGRQYRVECWAEDGMTVLTYFFSTGGLENMTDAQFADFLEREDLIRYPGEKSDAEAMPLTGASGNDMWSVSVVVGIDRETYVEDHSKLRPYRPRWPTGKSARSAGSSG